MTTPKSERCPVCGQPDNCGDCDHFIVTRAMLAKVDAVVAASGDLVAHLMEYGLLAGEHQPGALANAVVEADYRYNSIQDAMRRAIFWRALPDASEDTIDHLVEEVYVR